MKIGSVISLQIASAGKAPMQLLEEVHAVPGKGLEGDRYFAGHGTFSPKAGPAHEITFIEAEAVEALNRNLGANFAPADFRRSVTTRGVALNHLVDQEFFAGDVRLKGLRLCEPCAHLESLTREGVKTELLHRGGLRAQILSEGRIRVGDSIRQPATGARSHKELIRRYYEEMWNPWNFDLADELLAPDFSFRGSLGAVTKGRDAFRDYMRQVRRAFHDFHKSIEEMIEGDDSIAARLSYRGTHRGELFGVAPTGREITYSGAAFFRIAAGKVAEGWVLGDLLTLLKQIGAPTIP